MPESNEPPTIPEPDDVQAIISQMFPGADLIAEHTEEGGQAFVKLTRVVTVSLPVGPGGLQQGVALRRCAAALIKIGRVLPLALLLACGGGRPDGKAKGDDCVDHLPDPDYHGRCYRGSKLVVEDHVAVCRCPKARGK